ncbi:unnamed protein product [Rhizophagus irregularis]|nr:unnamed protein product [Rhizophagus irregularis]
MKVLDDCRKDIRNKLMLQKEVKRNEYIVEIIEEALIVNEFNLYWEKILITAIAIKFSAWQCSDDDTKYRKYRTYKIKNLVKELPTYSVLYKRKVQRIDNDTCPRCKKGLKIGINIWICECNSWTMKELIESINEYET